MKVKTKGQLKIEIKQAEREIVRPGSELESTQTEAARHTKEVGQVSASTNWEDVYRTQTARIAELEQDNAALRSALVEFRDACWDAFSLRAPNVKPYYALVRKHATLLSNPIEEATK